MIYKKESVTLVLIKKAFFITLFLINVTYADEKLCRSCISSHYQSARDSVIRAWSVLDMLRSMSIEPRDRAGFAIEVADDLLIVLTDLTAVTTTCQFCDRYYQERAEDIYYLEEILGSLADAFRAVFMPVCNGEELMLQSIMMQSAQKIELIKKQLKL